MASYLVTGGCGFIGSHLVDTLSEQGHRVRVIDNLSTGCRNHVPEHCELLVGDVCDTKLLEQAMQGVDGCFHLAGKAQRDDDLEWLHLDQTNLIGSLSVLNAARKYQTPVVYTSSAEVYGDNADLPLSERSVARPITAYGADKLAVELYARVASMRYGVPTMGLRMFDVFGPRQNPRSRHAAEVNRFVELLLTYQSLEINGDGEQRRDYVYVKDAVGFLIAAMGNVSVCGEVINACRGEALSVNQLTSVLMAMTATKVKVRHLTPARGGIRMSIGSPKLAAMELNYSAKMSVTEGLREFIAHRLQLASLSQTG